MDGSGVARRGPCVDRRRRLAGLGLRRDGGEIEQPHVYPWSTVLRVPTDARQHLVQGERCHAAPRGSALVERFPKCVLHPALAVARERSRSRLDADGRRGEVAPARTRPAGANPRPLARRAGALRRVCSSTSRRGPTTWLRWASPTSASPVLPSALRAASPRARAPGGRGRASVGERAPRHEPLRRARRVSACRRRSSTTTSTTARCTFATGATCSSTGATPASRIRSSRSRSRSRACSPGGSTTSRARSTRRRSANAYLAAFADYGDRSALEAAATIALRLGWVCRAVNARLGNPEGSNTDVHLRMFLDGRT